MAPYASRMNPLGNACQKRGNHRFPVRDSLCEFLSLSLSLSISLSLSLSLSLSTCRYVLLRKFTTMGNHRFLRNFNYNNFYFIKIFEESIWSLDIICIYTHAQHSNRKTITVPFASLIFSLNYTDKISLQSLAVKPFDIVKFYIIYFELI